VTFRARRRPTHPDRRDNGLVRLFVPEDVDAKCLAFVCCCLHVRFAGHIVTFIEDEAGMIFREPLRISLSVEVPREVDVLQERLLCSPGRTIGHLGRGRSPAQL
jgi:hypothetical protein